MFAKAQVNEFILNQVEINVAQKHQPFFNKARLSFESKQFADAHAPLDSLLRYYPELSAIQYLNGISLINREDGKKQGLILLKNIPSGQSELPNIKYWLAVAFEKNDSISKAELLYRQYISDNVVDVDNADLIVAAKRSIENLKAAAEMKDYSNFANIKNLGTPINTEAAEYVPLVPSDESFMIFTYRGKLSKGGKRDVSSGKTMSSSKVEEKIYFEDVFISNKLNDSTWSVPKPIKSINSNLHDAAVTLSPDGTQLFIYKNYGKGNGDLYLSTLKGNNWSVPVYQKGLNSDQWDGSAAFVLDNQHIIFSSERKGGNGGKDLYYAEKIGDNLWGNIKNLGDKINSSYDEDAPFVTADGKILFFASNGKLSTGGYDVLRSDLTTKGWGTPFNIGKPVNTVNDDKFYMVTADSRKGYYSSTISGGFGDQDIYRIKPGIPGKPVKVVQVTGCITYNNKPAGGKLEIRELTERNPDIYSYDANTTTGKFLANLPAGSKFELLFSYKNLKPQKKIISTRDIDSTTNLTVIADFYSDDVEKQLKKKSDSLMEVVRMKYGNMNYNEFREKHGNTKVDSLIYYVQIAAYKFIENYDYSTTMRIGMKIRRSTNEIITRFTVGNFDTFNEAEEKLKVLKGQGIKDAFIIVFYKNKYCYLSDLIKSGVYK